MQRAGCVVLLGTLLVCGLLAYAGEAHGKSSRGATYAYDRVWPALLRFIRIDEKHTIVEKDAEAGYVLFTVAHEGKSFSGSLELIRTSDRKGRAAVRVVVQIEDRPPYMEVGFIERFLRKLRHELGSPEPAPEPSTPPAQEPQPTT